MTKRRPGKRSKQSHPKPEDGIHLIEKRCKTIEIVEIEEPTTTSVDIQQIVAQIEEPTTSADVERIVALFTTKKLVILQGPHGCGKTYTANWVAKQRNVPLKVLQINEQYDSKVLYGSYSCSEVPGEFFWQPSKFAQFLQRDCVLLLENLDHGGSDLASAIIDLAERGHAVLANGRHIPMGTQCRILGTISREEHQHHTALIWRDYPFTVRMAPIQPAQMDSILAQMTKSHHELFNIRSKLLQTFVTVSALINHRKASMDRALNAKDLFRVISHLVNSTDQQQHSPNSLVSDRNALFGELFDAWAAHLSGDELRRCVAAVIGEALSLSPELQQYHIDVRFPDVSIMENNNNENISSSGRIPPKQEQHQQKRVQFQFGRVVLEQRTDVVQQEQQQSNNNNRSGKSCAGVGAPFVLIRDAAQLLERVAACVSRSPPEPVLLTGDTGVGKTATVQHMARLLRVPLHVVNLSQESEFSDLVGGHKPTSVTNILRPLVDEYISLFNETFNAEKNAKFLDNLNNCFNSHRFADLVQLIVKSSTRALKKFAIDDADETHRIRRDHWTRLLQRTRRLAKCFRHSGDDAAWRRRLLFAHVKGVLTEAAERGDWLLVDELNLAPVECMDTLIELFDPSSDFIVHADFRLFACMNSANDVGKRLLPLGIRSAFTEFFVAETSAADQLRLIIRGQISTMGEQLVESVLQFYTDVRAQFPGKFNLRTLSRALAVANDQLQQRHYGTARHCLCRACSVAFVSQLDIEQRNRMQLVVTKWLGAVPSIARNAKLSGDEARNFVLIEGHKIPRGPLPVLTNDDNEQQQKQQYIFTPSVRANMALLASVVATGHFPVLMEGETSAGKTSMVMQLAKMSGNQCFRVNNHEHTDVQEYIGSYAPDSSGRLEFVEGVLLRVVRNGDWIILDELNLAPSAVLEALNRLLDDNRELFVSELNITVRAHPRFRLFATQNPVGTYAGRKRLSRAFLSRFMCLQWEALPHVELPNIVQRRCGVSPRMAELMAAVLAELKVRRAIGGIFASSDGLMTLRDLFRWGHRMSSALEDGHATADWRQALADQGYFVLGTRCRTKQDEQVVVDVLQRLVGRQIDIPRLFGADSPYMPPAAALPGLSSAIVLTAQMRRMLILCAEAWRRDEPVLLVGETGCGKTTAVHQFGDLLSINCHERTDSSDLLGSIRPINVEEGGGGGFRWRDGIVLQAMRRGQRLLVDEISLAPDSVLERLNSLLEPQRAILLTDAGAAHQSDGTDSSSSAIGGGGAETVTAAGGFQLVATMNPGNDHGKKELSKALRNRFTEVWCPAEHDHDDLLAIVRHRLLVHCQQNTNLGDVDDRATQKQLPVDKIAQFLIKFAEFFTTNFNHLLRFSFSTRDLVTLSELFAKFYFSVAIPLPMSLFHAIEANVFDALGVLPSRLSFDRRAVIDACIKQFHSLISELALDTDDDKVSSNIDIGSEQQLKVDAHALRIGPFSIENFDDVHRLPVGFSLNAPATRRNALRVARALASTKPVMLEGSPGAGKSSLIVALAAATGHKLVRLNLSEQTDLHDLFGGDMPVTGPDGSASFTWRDGPVLKAIKEGCWILLDEMNLASQSVLEGLNSCFDFRKQIYIAELDRTFTLDCSRCKFFACQNPHQQGGDRRALPKSFLNRFISIFVEEMTDDDFIYILCEFCKARQAQTDNQMIVTGEECRHSSWSPSTSLFTDDRLAKMVLVNKLCRERVQPIQHQCGGPFEFNLRDLFRWVEAVAMFGGNFAFGFELIYLSRLTKQEAREKIIAEVYNPVFGDDHNDGKWLPSLPMLHLSDAAATDGDGSEFQLNIGCVPLHLCRGISSAINNIGTDSSTVVSSVPPIRLLATQLGLLERVAACMSANWLVLLSGPPHVGKRSTVRTLATLVDQPLEHIRLTSETDALELRGSFEQIQDQQQPETTANCGGEQIGGDGTIKAEQMDCGDELVDNGQQAESGDSSGKSNLRFEWVDSVFVRAFRDGHWLLVEDVNCCSSAVLDCLNSCLESADGELVLPVQQHQQSDIAADGTLLEDSKVRRHANFRIFFTMNPKNGQLSRAMRNRAVELAFGMDTISVTAAAASAIEPPVWSANAVDVVSAVPLLPRAELISSSSLNSIATPIVPASSKQLQLVSQLQHKLNGSIDCAELLCCAAQVQHCIATTNATLIGQQQQFFARLELFLQSFCNSLQTHDDDDTDCSPPLGFNIFPHVLRPCASTIKLCYDELSLYYWHCWSDVSSTVHVHHNKHADACLQLAFMFPGSFIAQKRMWPAALRLGFFGTINESRQKELLSLLSMNMASDHHHQYHVQSDDFVQLLLEHTFPLESRVWSDPRKLAVNDTEIGRKYLAALRASPAHCHPFYSASEMQLYMQRWLNNNNFGKVGECRDNKNATIFQHLGHHFAQIIHFLNRIFDDNQSRMTTTLPWGAVVAAGDDDDGVMAATERAFSFGLIGSAYLDEHLNGKDLSSSRWLFFSHLQLPFITRGLNECLWHRLHFDPGHVLRHMRVAELVNVSAQLDHAFLSIWELCFARKNVHNATRELFRNVAAQFGVDIQLRPNVGGANHVFDSSQLFAMLAKLVDALTSLTPPQQLMDPPAFTQLQRNYWRERLKQVAVYVNALQMFLQLTNAKSYDTDQLVAAVICCSSFPLSPCSSTSILRQICAVHRDISNSLLQLEPEKKTAPSNDDELPKSTVFRCWLSNLDQFRHDFVDLLRNASAHLSKAIGSVAEDASNLLLQRTNTTTTSSPPSRADVVQQNIQNILTTISTLKAFLTTNQRKKSSFDSTLSEVPFLFVYPDLVAPYLHVLNLLSIALSELGRQIASAQNIERVELNYSFSHSEFYGLNQLLHCSSQSAGISATNNDFAIDVQPFIRWLIADHQTPLTVSDRLPICLWSIAAPFRRRPFSQCRADVLGWLLHLWEQWHEQNVKIKAKEQLVVKRKRKRRKQNDEEELEMMDDGGDECVHMESDDQKLRDAYLPDFSNSAADNNQSTPSHLDAAAVVADQFSVSKDEVHDALCNLFKTLSSNDEDDEAFANSSSSLPIPSPPFMPLLSVIGKLELFGSATNQTEHDEDLAYPQLLALDKLREQLQLCEPSSTKFPSLSSSSKSVPEVPKTALNVYRDSEPSAVVKCVECLAPLHQRVQLLLDEFPENGQLSSLSFTIDAFVNKASAGVPLMKHAAQLESILVRAEEWESIADRAHSIREQMVPLQALLVEWRRREVHCWAELVNMVRADCAQLAVLAGWPLFKCALDTLKNEEQQQQNGAVPADENNNKNTLILAFVDWMHNATVGDFDARLWTGQLLIKCLPVLAPPNCAIVVGTLCRHMRSTCAHFAQFNRTLRAHFDDRFAPVQRSLHDFCRAVRYTDLNVWSVQDSARRAHTHLVRILRSFKNLNDEPVFPLLFEKPSPPLEWVTPTPSELDSLPQPNALAQTDHHQQQQTIGTAVLSRFVTRLEASVVQMLGGVDALDVLRTDAMAMLNELQTNIVYESVVVDPQPLVAHKPGDHDNNVQSVNEKRHGRALFVRQQQFSRLVRAAARIGLNVRRAQHIDTEKLTMQTVAEADALHHLSDTIGTHFRHSTAARNVFLRQFAIFRRHNSQQQEQLTPATLEQLRSIVEYTLHWMLNAVTALGGDQQRFGAAHRRAVHVARCIAVEAQNAADAVAASIGHAEDYGSFSSSHLCLSDQFVRNDKLISALTAVVDQMRKLHQICPRQQQHSDAVQIDKEHQEQSQSSSTTTSSSIPVSLHGSAVQTPLGSLRQPSTEHAELDAELSTLDQLLERLKRCHSDVQIGSVPIPCDSRHLRIWNRTMWRTYIECLNAVHATFSELSLAKLGDYFVDQFAELGPIFDQLLSAVNTTEIGNQQQHQTEFECVESAVLLYLQSIYKEVEQYSSNNNANDGDGIGSSAPPPPLLDCVKRVLEFVNKLNSEKVLTQLYDWFLANSSVNTTISSPMVADRLAKAYTLAHGLSSALCHLHHHIGTFAAQLASFHAHWSAVGCHLLANGFVNPIPIVDRQKGGDEADGKRAEAGDGFGDGDLAPNATDVSSQVENMEQIEGLKNDGSDQQQQQMDDQENNADQQQQQQHKMDESEQPIDVEDDFAGCLEALDAGEDDEQGIDGEDNDDEQQQREDIDDRADWNFGEVEEPEETQLDPKLWEDEQNDEQQAEEREQQDNNETMDHAKGDQRQMLDDDDDACAKNDDTNADQQEMDQSQVEGADKADWTAAGQEEEGDKAKPTAAADEHAEEHGEADGDDQQQNEGDVDNEQQQQKIDEANQQQSQPVDGEENFAGQLEGLDAEEGEEGNEDDNEAGAGEEQEETQLDPKSLEDEQNEQQQTEEQGQQQQDSNETGDHEKGWGVQQQQQSMDNGDDDACADNNDLRNNVDDQQRRQQQRLDQSQADGADEADWTAGQDEGDKAKPTAADEPAEEHGDAEGDDQQQQQNMEDDGAAGGDHQRQLQQQEMGELSAHGSASLEQARQTRALFHSHLRRLRQQQQQQQQLDQSQLEGADQAADDQKMADQDEEAAAAMLVAREEEEEGMAESVGCNFGDLLNGPEVMRFDPKLWQNDEEQNDDGQQQQSKEEAMEMEEEREGTSRDDGDDQQQQLQHRLQLKWALITDSVAPLAAELAESLRAIIEPTIASRLEGDYRTGKRLNMRRLIPYIASDYRKDRIWMRRTRKARRNYQICIAVDNSQSMQHNHMTEITCNALCLIERALRQLEVGQLALCSFGSQVQLIADFAASEHDDHQQGAVAQPLGARILRQLRFDQQRTDLGQLLDVTRTMFTRARDAGCAPQHAVAAEQLLIIIGDGRGVFSEGAQRIRQAIGRLFADRVTVLFLVMDVPPPPTSASTAAGAATSSHKSIMDMRIADFSADGQSCTFRSYMAQFPFPLYALVRDTRTVPATVAEAVRQWFEHTANG